MTALPQPARPDTQEEPAVWVPPLRNSENDIPYQVALSAHRNTSMIPDRRAEQERAGYAEHMRALVEKVGELTGPMDEERAAALAGLERYRDGYLRHYLPVLYAGARTASAMVVGPANFPTERNRKACETEHRRRTEFLAWEQRARAALLRDVRPPEQRAVSSDDPNAPETLDKKVAELEAAHAKMLEANRIVRSKASDDVKVRNLMEQVGLSEGKARELLVPDFAGRRGFPSYSLGLNRKEITRLRERAEQIRRARKETSRQWTVGDVRVVDHVEENRVRIHFPDKPPEGLRNALRAQGFLWAPSAAAWQRKRTTTALWAAARLLGATLDAEEATAVDEDLQ